MAKGRISRKELLNEPDRFMVFVGRVIDFAKRHLTILTIGAVAFFLSLITVVVVTQVSHRNEIKASASVEKAMATYASVLKDKDEAAAYEAVKGEFSEIFDAYGSKQAAKIARIVYGDMSYSAGDADTAITMYQKALDDFEQAPAMKPIILSGLGHAYLLKKEYPKSIGYFEKILESQENLLKSDALFSLAWLYETTGDKVRSTEQYKKLLADFPDSVYGDMVKEKIQG